MTTLVSKKKNNNIKDITVEFGKDKLSTKFDSSLFESEIDMVIEACTRIIEKHIKKKRLNKITPIMLAEYEIKGRVMSCAINVYKILINAAHHDIAESLRSQFKKEFDIDLKNEPIRSKING